jgi:hypothetical protein
MDRAIAAQKNEIIRKAEEAGKPLWDFGARYLPIVLDNKFSYATL